MRHPILPRGRELGLPVFSGLLLTLSFPPFHLLVPPFVALVPYLIFVAGSPQDAEGARSVRRASFWMGVVFYGTLLYWLFAALVYYTWLSLLGYLITVVVLSGFLAGAGWGIHLLRSRGTVPFWITAPVFWTAAEWLRGHLGDLAFPWLGLGHSLTGFPWLVGFADLTGARGVTVWLAAINGSLAEIWLARSRRRPEEHIPAPSARGVRVLALLTLVAVPIGYSLARWFTLETRPAARVLVVQPNIPEDLKLDRETAIESSREALEELTESALAADSGVDLVVWPETALPTSHYGAPGWEAWAKMIAERHDVSLLYGFIDVRRYQDGGYDYFNAAQFVNAEGEPAGVYRKHYLVPVVERVPFLPVGWLRDLRRRAEGGLRLPLIGDVGSYLRWFGGYGRGGEEPVLGVDGSGFGVLVCYESIFAGLSRRYRRQGADFLVNITNDAWFGRERPLWSRTSALFQHPAHLVMRAIENRLGIARAANTGISLFVDPRGRLTQPTRLFQPAYRVDTVETTDGLTFYARLGDWPGWSCVLGALVLIVVGLRRRREGGTGELT